jgi:hypothetical protein
VASTTTPNITATLNDKPVTAQLTVNPSFCACVEHFNQPSSIVGGAPRQTSTETITLGRIALPGGTVVKLTSSIQASRLSEPENRIECASFDTCLQRNATLSRIGRRDRAGSNKILQRSKVAQDGLVRFKASLRQPALILPIAFYLQGCPYSIQ